MADYNTANEADVNLKMDFRLESIRRIQNCGLRPWNATCSPAESSLNCQRKRYK